MKKIGLTGRIGVGKTFVAKLLHQMAIPIFNADVEAKKCMDSDSELIKKIELIFGNLIYIDGKIQKKKLANIIFSDIKKLNELNINIKGDIFYVSYNSPYKVFNRRNEAMVEIIYEN